MFKWIEVLEQRKLLSGEPDSTFGTGGIVTSDFDAYSEQFTKIVSGPGGKTYAAGFLGGSYLVARYTSTGQLDTTFNNGAGYVSVLSGTGYAASGLAVSAEGEIYVGGSAITTSSATRAAIVAITPAGQLDDNFASGGVWTGTWSGQARNDIAGMAVVNGSLYVGLSDNTNFGVARFTTAGALDTSFGVAGTGVALYATGNNSTVARDFVYATPAGFGPGQLVVAGNVGSGAVAVRFNLNGTRDLSFSSSPLTVNGNSFTVSHTAVDPSGRVWLAGALQQRAALMRLTTGGLQDGSGLSGVYQSNVSSEYTVTGLAVVDNDNLIYTAPGGASAGDRVVELDVRPTYGFVANKTFGTNGTLVGLPTRVADIARQPDGKLVLAGRVLKGADMVDTQLVRLNAPSPVTQIDGFIFNDANGNGVNDDNLFGSVSGVSAYLDLNQNGAYEGSEPTASYNPSGKFTFANVAPGTYQVGLRIDISTHARQTLPANNALRTVTTNGQFNSVGSFGVQPLFPISGFVFDDLNFSATQDNGEAGIAGRTVWIDTDADGLLDNGEDSTLSEYNGFFVLYVPRGSFKVRQIVPPGYRETGHTLDGDHPGSTFAVDSSVRVLEDIIGASPLRFGSVVSTAAVVSGSIFNDANGNGQPDTGEKTYIGSGLSVYLDANGNSQLDANEKSVYTGGTGEYTFTGVDPGSYTLRLTGLSAAGVRQTSPYGQNGFSFTLQSGDHAFAGPFGVQQVFTAHGVVFDDGNGDTAFYNESGIPGRTVFADDNNDGILNNNEPSAVTDANGRYALVLSLTQHPLRQILPPGYRQTGRYAPDARFGSVFVSTGVVDPIDAYADLDFGSQRFPVVLTHVYGAVVHDYNGNGIVDSGEPGNLPGDLVFVDTNNNGDLDIGEPRVITATYGWAFDLPPGIYNIRQQLPAGTVQTMPAGNAAFTYTLTGTNVPIIGYFGQYTPATLSLGGTVYNDINKNYKRDTGEPGMAQVRVYVDTNNNSTLDDTESTTYTNASGAFTFPPILATGKNATVRVVLPAGYTLKYPSSNGGYIVPLTAKANVTTLNFGLAPGPVVPPTVTPTTVTGLVYNDVNQNAAKDAAEPGLAGVTVFADLNGNGVLEANEARTTTTSTGTYTLNVTPPAGASVQAIVRVVLPSGYLQLTPVPSSTVIQLYPGAVYNGENFGLYKPVTPPPTNTASISGIAFNDANKNGVYDSGDSLASGKTVWLDLDDDGVKDANEASAVTDSAGKFTFKNLAAGKYHVRRVFPTGYLESTPARYITLTNGQAATDVRIGSKIK